MSSKWRAIQHRHRYTYNSVAFPKQFAEALDAVSPEVFAASDFFPQLRRFIDLTSTYAQVAAVKELAAAFAQLVASAPEVSDRTVSAAVRLYLEILFLENSLPLHRMLISGLAKCRRLLPLIGSCFLSLCEYYGSGGSSAKKGKKTFLVSRAALSIISYPKMDFLKETLENCADLVALDVVAGLGAVISDVDGGLRPSPVVMEQCQEALSCLYYLLQRYSNTFVSSEAEVGSATFRSIIRTILSVLKSSAFSRDCLVAAGVSFCSALQICVGPSELSFFISRGLYGVSSNDSDADNFDVIKVLPQCEIYATIQELSTLSRLCLLRGILTAIPRNVLNMCLTQTSSGSFWTILYDGILPDLCKYCENPIDSHFNFHALTVTQICLQQIKTSIVAGLTDFATDYHPFTEDAMGRVLKIIWNNLEDPLSQTIKQVHLVFDLLLDIELSLPSVERRDRGKQFLHKIAKDLLCLGPRCKGRYVPLAAITKRLGAKTMLEFNPKLLYETSYAYVDDDVCCAVTSFLKCFLECLRDECWSSDGVEKGYDTFRDFCLPPLLQGLVSGHSKLRSNLNTYALPLVLEVDTDSIFPMLAYISIGPNIGGESIAAGLNIEHCVAALVSLLKVSRTLALIEGDIDFENGTSLQHGSPDNYAFLHIKGINVRVPVEWIVLALKHADDSLRIDAAESLFLNPKTSSLPSALELSLMKVAVPLNMRCTSTAFQMKWTSLFRKLFSRVRTALERQVKQHSWNPRACLNGTEDCIPDHSKDLNFYRARELFQFMKWLSCYLFNSCYPSAPYERKTMAMELILVMIDVWPIVLPQGNDYVSPYTEVITSPDSTLALVGSIIDSWDRLRENSFRILLSFPTPLPGISTNDSLNDLIRWAKKLVCSPRVRESDAGALTLRLIFKKYVVGLGWAVESSTHGDCFSSQEKQMNGDLGIHELGESIVDYISSLIEWLSIVVEEGERDLSESCNKSFVHGVLLTLRYTFEELDWSSHVVQSSILEMRRLVERLLELIMRITSLALWVVSADIWSMPYDMEDVVDDSTFLIDTPVEQDISDLEQGDRVLTTNGSSKPAEHVVMVGCWLAMKEVSLLLATIIRKIPLPHYTFPDLSKHGDLDRDNDGIGISNMNESVLDLVQLEKIGNHFLQVLLKMKHNGAIDKTRAGFTALCNRLLCSNDPRLCKMIDSWMEQLMERTTAKGQTVDDLLRRSAGIPAAFLALFLSEPEGTPKKLLPKTLRWLIDVANSSLLNSNKDSNLSNEAAYEEVLTNSDMIVDPHMKGQNSKIRDEGVVPTVHAFNVLRVAFDDTNLATDTSGFCAEAMIISIRSFSSSYWEVRNSACLAYTALVRRMIGFLNTQRRESARRALTGLEFFHRYPALHPFLFSELKVATELFGDGCSGHMEINVEKVIHPSLCPILILLTRLKPSLVSHRADDSLDPFSFMPFIRKCATQSNLRLRVLASRALTGLVSNEKLLNVIREAAHGLPCQRNQMSTNMINGINGFAEPANSVISFNSIHGVLLQLASLLDNNCRQLPDISKKDQILGELIHVLLRCTWIGSIRACPCPTLNSSFLRVLDLMLDLSRTCTMSKHTETIQSLLLELASECLVADKSYGLIFQDPTTVELRKQAVISYFNCLSGGDPEGCQEGIQLLKLTSPTSKLPENKLPLSQLEETILSCIHDPTYEVRIATLKKLLQLVRSMIPGECNSVMRLWAQVHLHPLLIKLLSEEENPKCMYYILKIIFNWDLLQLERPSDSVGDFLYPFWNRLVELNSSVKHAKTREISLCCMGICVKQFAELHMTDVLAACRRDEGSTKSSNSTNLTKSWPRAFRSINQFINLIKHHSAASEPVSMRRAVAEAIIASGLLKEARSVAPFISASFQTVEGHDINIEEIISESALTEVINVYACRILDLWFTCIQLLEDEDAVLREKLANDVQNCISSRSPNSSFTDATPAQVDRMIQSSFDFLSSTLGNWVGYLNYLSKCVLLTASSTSTYGDLVRQIFDKEIDNHHEEKLLICQLCCLHLKKLTENSWIVGDHHQAFDEHSMKKFSWRWRMRFLCQLTSFANGLLETEGRTDWIGGIGNHKDAFVPVYANLLGLYALSHCSLPDGLKDKDKYLSEFMELGGVIRPFLKNPLISNLYHQVLQLHKSMSSQTPNSQLFECSPHDTFDPFFLV